MINDDLTPPANAIRSSTGHTWIDEHGIIIAVADAQDIHTLEHAKESVAAIAALTQGVRRPFLIDMTNVKSMSREARAYHAGPEPAKVINAVAILTGSNIGKMIANFFISLTNPVLPTRMFTGVEDAKQWLLKYTKA